MEYFVYYRIGHDGEGDAVFIPVLVDGTGALRVETAHGSSLRLYTADQAAKFQAGIELAATVEEAGGLDALHEELSAKESAKPSADLRDKTEVLAEAIKHCTSPPLLPGEAKEIARAALEWVEAKSGETD